MDIESLINIELQNINEKIKGTSYLEKLKYNLIKKFDGSNIYENDNLNVFEKEVKLKENNIEIKISATLLKNPVINLNQTLSKNTLFLPIKGMIKIDLFNQKLTNKTKKIVLLPKTGVCLPQNTILNINFIKNSYILKIEYFENDNENNIFN